MYTRGIDSNLESGRYISRVGRTSRFLFLYLLRYLRYLRYGTVGTYGTVQYSTTVNTYGNNSKPPKVEAALYAIDATPRHSNENQRDERLP